MPTSFAAVALLGLFAGLVPLAATPAWATRIVALGDELVAGVPLGAPLGATATAARSFPARLARHLGPGSVVVNRGLPGTTAGDWLGTLGLDLETMRFVVGRAWPDRSLPPLPHPQASLLTYVLAIERPDAVLIVVGSNDLRSRPGGRSGTMPAVVADRLIELAARARVTTATVLVGTIPASPQVSPEVAAAVNDRLCRAVPDCVRLDRALPRSGEAPTGGSGVPASVLPTGLARAFAKALERAAGRGG